MVDVHVGGLEGWQTGAYYGGLGLDYCPEVLVRVGPCGLGDGDVSLGVLTWKRGPLLVLGWALRMVMGRVTGRNKLTGWVLLAHYYYLAAADDAAYANAIVRSRWR